MHPREEKFFLSWGKNICFVGLFIGKREFVLQMADEYCLYNASNQWITDES